MTISRRCVLSGAATLLSAAASAATQRTSGSDGSSRSTPARRSVRDTVIARSDTAIAEIDSGKIAGYLRQGIFAFKGIPYAQSTAGINRFCPPRKLIPWTGVRSCRQYGFVAPQDKGTGRENDEEAFMFQWNDSVEGEDCLRINLWTPAIRDNGKRPVMVWLHGGGFAAGSGHDLPAFDGENLSCRGNVVVVTLNHRLNILGFLDLSQYDSRYERSGNVGMLDIIAALEWVRDNISAFGGDPDRVLIFGQSGGGAKVSTLMAMPAAQGLFHRAIVQSGSFALSNTPDKSQRLTEAVLRELGLQPTSLERIQSLPYSDLRRASEAALGKLNPVAASAPDLRRLRSQVGFGPVADGRVLPSVPFRDGAPQISARVPMIVGTTLNEFATGINHPEYEAMSDAELQMRTAEMFPGRARQVIETFRRRSPHAKPFDLWSRIASSPVRQAAIGQAIAKSALNAAPAYLYWFTWQTPILDGRPRAFHCAELPFVFCNTDRCENMTGGGESARALSARLADAWIQFARTGDPNHAGVPRWSPVSAHEVPTMLFDDETRQVVEVDEEEQASIRDG